MVITNYRYKGQTLPKKMRDKLLAYEEDGTNPGLFLYNCLCNDLIGAVNEGNLWEREVMPAVASYIYHRMPKRIVGSREVVSNWRKEKGHSFP